MIFKGEPTWCRKLVLRRWEYANAFVCMLHLVVLWIFIRKTSCDFVSCFCFCFEFELLGVLPCCFALSLTSELARDVFDTFVTYAGLVYNVTDTVCGAYNGSANGCVSVTFKSWFWIKGRNSGKKTALCLFFPPFFLLLSTAKDSARDTAPVRFLFNTQSMAKVIIYKGEIKFRNK